MSTDILISLVAIIWMFTPASERASNIMAATPGLDSIPAPTTDSLVTPSQAMFFARSVCFSSSTTATASSRWLSETVKEMSLVLSRPTDCRMMSMLIFLAARAEKMRKAMPGTSSSPMREMRVTWLSRATPLMSIFSIFATSLITVPGFSTRLESTSRGTLYFFAISTLRLWSTWAPRVASSSISS